MNSLEAKLQLHKDADALIRSLYTGKTGWSAAGNALQLKLRSAYATLAESEEATFAFEMLLGQVRSQTELLTIEPVVSAFGPVAGNTTLDALLHLSLLHEKWLCPVEEWIAPQDASARSQFASLFRHLFARYEVPLCFDTAFFEGFTERGERHRSLFLHLGEGQNLRRAPQLPLRLTEKMAHHALFAPANATVVTALRYGQTLGLGGTPELALSLSESRLNDFLPDEPFWESVIHFFVNYTEGRFAQVAPMIDFISQQRYGETLRYRSDKMPDLTDAPEPDFSMKGRKWQSLQTRVDDWHYALSRDAKRPKATWEPTGIKELSVVEPDFNGFPCEWTIVELLTTNALLMEGGEQRHCVFSYASGCKNGGTSIWSLRVRGINEKSAKRVLTIEVNNHKRALVQVRGRCNLAPSQFRSTSRMGVGRKMLRLWAQREKLSISGVSSL